MSTRFIRFITRVTTFCVSLGITGCVAPRAGQDRPAGGPSATDTAAVDPHYTPEGLMRAFQKLCASQGYHAVQAQIDDSDFPYLVHGIIAGRCDYADLREALSAMPDYAYSGSVVIVHSDGQYSAFALNMIPRRQYAQDRESQERVLERLKQLAAAQH